MPPKKKVEKEKVEKPEPVIGDKSAAKSASDRIGKLLAQKVFRELSKNHGDTILALASDARVAKSNRIPTGIFSLDKKLGGGLPQGRVITVYGMKSTGKTYIVLKTIAHAQRMCAHCWTDVEWLHAIEKDMESVDEKTGEVTKVLDAKGQPKKQKIWEPFYVRRWWADDSGKWRVMLRGEMILNPDEDARAERMMVPKVDLGEEIRPKCACGKYREPVCALIDVEGTLDKLWATRLGVELMKLMLSQPAEAETSLDIADAIIRSGECDVLAMDSLAFLTPQKEIEESTAKETMGAQPRIVGKGTRKAFVSGLNASGLYFERRPTILLVNQIRMKIGVVFGNPETQPAGLAPGFASSVEIKTKGGTVQFEKLTKEEETAGKDRTPLEIELPFDIEKNKTDVPKRSGNFRIILADGETKKKGDVYDEDVLMDTAKEYGVLKKEGQKWSCFNETYTAESHIERKLLTDPLFSQRLRAATLATIMAVDKAWDVEPEVTTPEETAEA